MIIDMSPAALPPRQPHITAKDREHPLFPTYSRWRSFMSTQLLEASSFRDWLASYEHEKMLDAHSAHPRFPEFQSWMAETKAGRRKCPVGFFPHNFLYWLEGGRW